MNPFLWSWVIAALGFSLGFLLIFARWPGWVGFPLSILLARVSVDAGFSPLLRYRFQQGMLEVTDATIVMPLRPDEIAIACAWLCLGYGAVLAGLLVMRASGALMPARPQTQATDERLDRRGFQGAVLLYFFGLAINGLAIVLAGRGLSFSEIASTRAAFTNEAAYGSVAFNYAWLLKSSMQVGALGMLLFAYRRGRLIPVAWAANFLYIAMQPVFGGRTAVVVGGLAIAFVYHHGVRRLRPWSLAVPVGMVLVGLVYIAIVRHGHESIGGAVTASVSQFASSRAAEEMNFALHNFPRRIEYFEGSTLVAGIGHALPGLKVGTNLWRTLQDEVLGPWYQATGIGGETISTHAENYMNYGVWGVAGIGLFVGLLFGALYEAQRRAPGNPFLLLAASMASIIFIIAIYKKLSVRLADIPFEILVPVGFMAAWAAGITRVAGFAMLCLGVLLGLLAYKFSGEEFAKWISFMFMILLYGYSLGVILNPGSQRRRRYSAPTAAIRASA